MVNTTKRVLVFDSGVGGLSVLDAIMASGRALSLDYVADNAWLPYGLKADTDLRARVPALLSRLAEAWAPDAVVVACNTASTIVLPDVRAALPIPVIGVVPPIKPAAALTKTGAIGLLATPATVQRPYTDDLIAQFAADKRVVRFGSAALVEAAERKLRGEPFDHRGVHEAVDALFSDGDVDVVALACTHFPLLAQELAAAAPRGATWLDSGVAIARRVADVTAAAPGEARAERAGFTDADAARALFPAFETRGFFNFSSIGDAPSYAVTPLI
jgi:glutamate racemase